VELKKGETILIDASLHHSAASLHEAFSYRSGVPPDHFELYYRSKRLEGEAALVSWGVGRDSTIEVKMRGRGGMSPGGSDGAGGSDGGGGVGAKVTDKANEAETNAPACFSVVIELHSGLTLEPPQASLTRAALSITHSTCICIYVYICICTCILQS